MRRAQSIFMMLVLVAASACGRDNTSRVTFDLAALYHHAAQAAPIVQIDALELLVTGEGLVYEPVSIDPTALTFDIDVPSGPARRFTLEAWQEGGTVRRTNYWGTKTVDLVPRGNIELVVPITPVGRVVGTVTLADDNPIPEYVDLSFKPDQLSPDLADWVTVVAKNGGFSTLLPVGGWLVNAEVTVGDVTYGLPADTLVTVVHGELIVPKLFTLYPPSAPLPATVSVLNSFDDPQNAVTILVHDSAGTLMGEFQTDTNGEAMVDVAADYMVTVVDGTDALVKEYRLYTAAGVQPGDRLAFSLPAYAGLSTSLGILSVTIVSSPATAQLTTGTIGCSSQTLSAAGATLIDIYDDCVGTNGTVDLLGIAFDGSFLPFAFSASLGHPSTDDTAILDAWDENPPMLEIDVTTIPAGAARVDLDLTSVRDDVQYYTNQSGSVVPGGSPLVTFKLPRGFFDYVDVVLRASGNMSQRSLTRRFLEATRPSTVSIDLAADMLPELTGALVNESDPAPPLVTWTTSASPSDYDFTQIRIDWYDSAGSLSWSIVAPPATARSWQAPAIPNTLPNFQPQTYNTTAFGQVEIFDFSFMTGYADFLSQIGPSFLDYYNEYQVPVVQGQTRRSSGTGGF
ncbi:MAG: hypothetical protein V3T05_06885 [Myxococcota bacterium]